MLLLFCDWTLKGKQKWKYLFLLDCFPWHEGDLQFNRSVTWTQPINRHCWYKRLSSKTSAEISYHLFVPFSRFKECANVTAEVYMRSYLTPCINDCGTYGQCKLLRTNNYLYAACECKAGSYSCRESVAAHHTVSAFVGLGVDFQSSKDFSACEMIRWNFLWGNGVITTAMNF